MTFSALGPGASAATVRERGARRDRRAGGGHRGLQKGALAHTAGGPRGELQLERDRETAFRAKIAQLLRRFSLRGCFEPKYMESERRRG